MVAKVLINNPKEYGWLPNSTKPHDWEHDDNFQNVFRRSIYYSQRCCNGSFNRRKDCSYQQYFDIFPNTLREQPRRASGIVIFSVCRVTLGWVFTLAYPVFLLMPKWIKLSLYQTINFNIVKLIAEFQNAKAWTNPIRQDSTKVKQIEDLCIPTWQISSRATTPGQTDWR